MEKTSLTRSLARVDVVGDRRSAAPPPTRGAGRPAASAAARMVGTMCAPMVSVPVIQVTVPSATVPGQLEHGAAQGGHQHGAAAAPECRAGRARWS